MVVPDSGKKEEVLELIKRKDNIEQEINGMGNILSANHIGMNEPLVDEAGFPRNDIDVYQVRHARHRIICLQNDLKTLMKEIEKGLEIIHSEASASGIESRSRKFDNERSNENLTNSSNLKPFLKVDLISPTSPAELAGLQLFDEIVEFGTINATNFKEITQIAELVKHRENHQINIRIKRNEKLFDLVLVPQKWNGRGLLGCNIVINYDSVER